MKKIFAYSICIVVLMGLLSGFASGEEKEVVTPALELQELSEKEDYLKGVYAIGIHPNNKILRELGAEWLRERAVYPFEDDGVTLSKAYLEAKAKIVNNKNNGFESYVQGVQIGAPRYNPATGKVEFMSGIPAKYGTFKDDSYYEAVEMIYEFQARDLADLVTYWQVSNEPDHGLYIDINAGMGPAHVVRFLKAAARGIHRGNPNAKVGTNLATTNDIAMTIMDELSQKTDDGSHFDWIGIDGYFGTLSPGGPETWPPLLDLIYERTGLPIIVVEWGFSSMYQTDDPDRIGNPLPGKEYSSPVCRDKRWHNTWNGQEHSPELQAEFIRECMEIFMEHPAVIGSFYFFYSDAREGYLCQLCGEPKCPFDSSWGLVDGSFANPKPSYYALQEIYGGGEIEEPTRYPNKTIFNILELPTFATLVSGTVNNPMNSKSPNLSAAAYVSIYDQYNVAYVGDRETATISWTVRNYTDGTITAFGDFIKGDDKEFDIPAGQTNDTITTSLNPQGWQSVLGLTVSPNSKGKITVSAITEVDGYAIHSEIAEVYVTNGTQTITFDGNKSTSGSMSPESVEYDSDFTIPPNQFVRDEYIFAGWNTAADGSGTAYADGDTIYNVTTNITLYAQWTEDLSLPPRPQTLYDDKPLEEIGNTDVTGGGPLNLGNLFQLKRDGYISALKYFNASGCFGDIKIRLYKVDGPDPATGDIIAEKQYAADGNAGWVTLELDEPLFVTAGYYIVAATTGVDAEGKSLYAHSGGLGIPTGDTNISFVFGRHSHEPTLPGTDRRDFFPARNWLFTAAATDVVFTRFYEQTSPTIPYHYITSILSIEDIRVSYGTNPNEIQLPSKVEVVLDGINRYSVDVAWHSSTPVDGSKPGKYRYTGTLINLPVNINNANSLTASLTVVVESEEETVRSRIVGFVDRLYNAIMDREAEEEGMDFWVNGLISGEYTAAEVLEYMLLHSPEFIDKDSSNEEFVEACYLTILGRPSDEPGRIYWVDRLEEGYSRRWVIANMLGAPTGEFDALCREMGIIAGLIETVKSDLPE